MTFELANLPPAMAGRVQPNDHGCWIWTGYRKPSGYGQVHVGGGRMVATHRYAYEAALGPIPDGYHVDHLCKVTACCFPGHLEAVAPRVNNARSDSPSAVNARKLSCVRGHPFDEANTYVTPGGTRHCRECHRERCRKYDEARAAERRVAKLIDALQAETVA